MRLLQENSLLRQQLDGYQESYLVPHSRVKQIALFDVVAEEDSIPVVFNKSAVLRKPNHILEQS